MLLSVVIWQKKERKGLYSIDAILENTILQFNLLEKSNAFDIKFHIIILKSCEILCMLRKVHVVPNEISIFDFLLLNSFVDLTCGDVSCVLNIKQIMLM